MDMMASGATLDRSRKYRYSLWREWDSLEARVLYVMLNPSRADAAVNDPTIASCIRLAKHNGFGSMEVVNLFAYRTKDPLTLFKTSRPIGKDNDRHIIDGCRRAKVVVLAWGNHGLYMERNIQVLAVLRDNLEGRTYCFGITKLGQPRHPLYLKYDAALRLYKPE